MAARSEARDAAVAEAEVRARLEAQVAALADRLASAEQAQRKSAHDLHEVQAELGTGQNGPRPKRRWRASCWQNCGWRHPGGRAGGGARPEARRRPKRRRKAKNWTKSRARLRPPPTRMTAATAVTTAMAAAIQKAAE
ncbi:hypothetical protein BJN34_36655 (plasmid) [Cupriavidus necator]|uniref:Uncharacterized protein n=1 Tax=Cupriavidus necator TaxID=106590 RepID=A0A1U9V453_CUPNE|nr:hypothetical protein BJN34_36655 [Cupriavidus necator]